MSERVAFHDRDGMRVQVARQEHTIEPQHREVLSNPPRISIGSKRAFGEMRQPAWEIVLGTATVVAEQATRSRCGAPIPPKPVHTRDGAV
jgi:hypothetical protein